jgi:endoglucanase
MRRAVVALILLIVALISPSTRADDQESAPDALVVNRQLGRGVNVLGWDPIWYNANSHRMTDEHFRLIHEVGFKHVRIVLVPFSTGHADAQGKLSDDWFRIVDWAIDQALANHLMANLDFHEYEIMSNEPEKNHNRFLSMWDQIARHCKDRPREVLFEVLNEPHGKLTPELWNQYLAEAVVVIRKSNPHRKLIIGPGQWNGIGQLEHLRLPADDRNIIATVHYYSPMSFTHQGASWTGQKDKLGVPWNGTPGERDAIRRDFDKAQAWARNENRPLYLGEFGAYDKADMDSRVRWTSAVARAAEERGWSWAYWRFDGDFIAYDIPNHRWVQPILEALILPR